MLQSVHIDLKYKVFSVIGYFNSLMSEHFDHNAVVHPPRPRFS